MAYACSFLNNGQEAEAFENSFRNSYKGRRRSPLVPLWVESLPSISTHKVAQGIVLTSTVPTTRAESALYGHLRSNCECTRDTDGMLLRDPSKTTQDGEREKERGIAQSSLIFAFGAPRPATLSDACSPRKHCSCPIHGPIPARAIQSLGRAPAPLSGP